MLYNDDAVYDDGSGYNVDDDEDTAMTIDDEDDDDDDTNTFIIRR